MSAYACRDRQVHERDKTRHRTARLEHVSKKQNNNKKTHTINRYIYTCQVMLSPPFRTRYTHIYIIRYMSIHKPRIIHGTITLCKNYTHINLVSVYPLVCIIPVLINLVIDILSDSDDTGKRIPYIHPSRFTIFPMRLSLWPVLCRPALSWRSTISL